MEQVYVRLLEEGIFLLLLRIRFETDALFDLHRREVQGGPSGRGLAFVDFKFGIAFCYKKLIP